MADEEVDWGMDEDVWRQGDGVPAGGANEDEISLDGMEAESEVSKPTSAKTATSPQTATSATRLPPTGPRRPPGRGDEPKSAGLPTGPKRNHPRNRNKNNNQRVGSGPAPGGVNGIMPVGGMKGMGGRVVVDTTNNVGASASPNGLPQAPASQATSLAAVETQPITSTPPELEPLPEGWTEVISRSQKAVFYHNKLTSETSWVRPRITPAIEEVVEDRPVTPPPTGAQATFTTGPKIVPGSSLPSKPAPNVLKQERPPPTGPGGGKSDIGRGPVKSDDQASPAIDPVQSAYARRTAMAGRPDQRNTSASVRQEDRGTKRSPSPRREEAKRPRMDDPPRNTERFPLPNAPAGPRSYADDSRTESPARIDNDRSFQTKRNNNRLDDNGKPRPSPASQKTRGPPGREPNSGSNTAPISNNKWGVKRDVDESIPISTLPPVPAAAALPPLPRTVSATDVRPVSTNDLSSRRAKIIEEKRVLEAKLRAIQDEEDKLDREESERRKQEDTVLEAERKRREDDRLREDEDRRRRDETWRRENERRGSNERPRVAYSDQSGYDERPHRSAVSPPRGPPPANRLDGPGPVPGLRDVRRARPESPNRITRRPSPGPYMPQAPRQRSQSREGPSRYANRLPSPPRRNADTYYPEGERDGSRDRRPPQQVVSLAERIGSRPSPARPRSPPPLYAHQISRRESNAPGSGPRPLAERMSRGVSGPREGWNGRDDIAAKRM